MTSRRFQFLRDIQQLAVGKELVPTERLLGPVFVLMAIAIFAALFAILSSLRPAPIVRPAPQILPVTILAESALEPAAPVILPVVAAVTPAPASNVPVPDLVVYHVRSGDTFGALGRQFCFDYTVVARENGITDPNWIYAGKTVLKFKNGCLGNAPSVFVHKRVSPRELVRNGEASSGKHISRTEATRAPITAPAVALAASAPAPSASQPIQAATPAADLDQQPLSELRHREIYRVAALKRIKPEDRTRAENAELYRLQMSLRKEVLDRYRLPNPDCLYAEAKTLGRNWEEQTLAQFRCIRENYGAVIDEVAAEYKLEPSYIVAIIMAESEGRPDAISPTGCTGVKQFTRRSAKLFGLPDRFDPFEGIRAGGRHLQDNLNLWRGNIAKATAHFNVGSVEVGSKGFNATNFPYTQNVLRVKRLIEKESKRLASGQPTLAPVSYTPAR